MPMGIDSERIDIFMSMICNLCNVGGKKIKRVSPRSQSSSQGLEKRHEERGKVDCILRRC